MKTSIVPSQPGTGTWYIVDADGQSVGRVAANIANVLRGKHKPTYSPHQLCADHVVVINVEKMAVSPAKARRKNYVRHSGYLGSMQVRSLGKMMEEHPERVMELAVKGMLPGNRLRPQMLKHMHVLLGGEHKYAAQKPISLPMTV